MTLSLLGCLVGNETFKYENNDSYDASRLLLDLNAPFVPEPPENLVVPLDDPGVLISCRVSDPNSHVVLRSVSSGEETQAYYESKVGFFGRLSPGQYQCETVVNGETMRSAVYTVGTEGESDTHINIHKHSE